MTTDTQLARREQPPAPGADRYPLIALSAGGLIVALIAGTALAVSLRTPAPRPGTAATPVVSPSVAAPAPTAATPQQGAATAAQEAYTQFTGLSDDALAAGGVGVGPITSVAVGEALSYVSSRAQRFREEGWRQSGTTDLSHVSVTSVNLTTDPAAFVVPEVVLRSCQDAGRTFAVDASGANIRPTDALTHAVETAWVRHYPQRTGYNGWFVARIESTVVKSC